MGFNGAWAVPPPAGVDCRLLGEGMDAGEGGAEVW